MMNSRKLLDTRIAAIVTMALTCVFFTELPALAQQNFEQDLRYGGETSAAFAQLQKYLSKKDYRNAFPLVKVMAERGYPNYQNFLAKLYLEGNGTKQDPKKAFDWFTLAAKSSYKPAEFQLGKMYFSGTGVAQDYKIARRWLEVSAPEIGDAAILLGRIYSDGLGTDRDYSKAIDAFEMADAHGVDAKIIIGILYSRGGFGVEKNFSQAKKWLELSAAQKNALAQCALGFVYYEGGHGLKKDLEKAKQCIKAAKPVLMQKAAQGNPAALTWLGRISYLGLFQNRDFTYARRCFEQSGDSDSLYMLAVMQRKGQGGIKKDYKKAFDLFKRADAGGSFPAKVAIGEMYYMGQGVPKNLCTAKKWFDQAGRNDDPVARYYLGIMYANGECAKKDVRRAKMFFELAEPGLELAKATNEDCVGYLKHLSTDLQYLSSLPADLTKADAETTAAITASSSTGAGTRTASTTSAERVTNKTVATAGSGTAVAPAVTEVSPVAPVTAVAPVATSTTSISTPAIPAKVRDFIEISEALKSLMTEFFPRGKVTKTDKSVHLEFKAKILKLPGTNKLVTVPESDGIVGDITVVPGRYEGADILPLQTNETYYVSLQMAPYSQAKDCHLAAKLLFPPNTTVDFVNRYKQLLSSFQ
ncbi:MAG: hypothetical protein SGJ27_30515 [Candidatus Melainabacteria bacterium]|nr:hypothetical protein [Candidatus Melainabacteria bacterium]